jgi:hypothetical protein
MIKQYLFVLILTYIEYFIFLFFLENINKITWENIKFWLKYPPFICLFFLMVDSWIVATMIYITFFYPYLLILYCIKNVNKNAFGNNRILINNRPHIDYAIIELNKKNKK